MEKKAPRTAKSRASRRRTKSSTAQAILKQKGITTRSMQRKSTYPNVEMKENCSSGAEMFSVAPDTSYMTKLQQQYTELACKENVLEQTEGLLHINVGPLLRPKPLQQQILPLPAAVPYGNPQGCGSIEMEKECFVEHDFVLENGGSVNHLTPQAECGNQLSRLNLEVTPYHNFISTATTSLPQAQPIYQQKKQQQMCKLRITSFMGSSDTSESDRTPRCPLPNLQWVHADELWQTMRSKDTCKVAPEAELRLRHPGILSSMRIILLDWVMEVCEEYRLHRESYYLAMDMFDRFMDNRTGIRKEQLQLLGVTCLFIAAKIEEIYPPKAAEFAYVTDGACSVEDLLDTELIICKVLNWRLNHNVVTASTWLNTYMQLGSHHLRPAGIKAKDFDFPAYSSTEFSRVMQLLDLCSFDISSRQFGSSVMAASAIYLQSERSERSRMNLSIMTGFELKDIQMCVDWMQPCAIVLSQKPLLVLQKTFAGVIPQDTHNIQTHGISISMLEDSMELRKSQEASTSQYMLLQDCSILMTPPRNERRCLAPINTSC